MRMRSIPTWLIVVVHIETDIVLQRLLLSLAGFTVSFWLGRPAERLSCHAASLFMPRMLWYRRTSSPSDDDKCIISSFQIGICLSLILCREWNVVKEAHIIKVLLQPSKKKYLSQFAILKMCNMGDVQIVTGKLNRYANKSTWTCLQSRGTFVHWRKAVKTQEKGMQLVPTMSDRCDVTR